jgi:excisionase family DNA binding protein
MHCAVVVDRRYQMNEASRPLTMYSIAETCQRGNFSRSFAYKLIKQGKLKVVKVGKRTLVKDSDFEACIEGFASNNAPGVGHV